MANKVRHEWPIKRLSMNGQHNTARPELVEGRAGKDEHRSWFDRLTTNG